MLSGIHYRKFLATLVVLPFLVACTTQEEWLQRKRHYPEWEFSTRQVNHYSFSWEMQGDEVILPVQVFSTQDEVWLQFAPHQTIPTVLGIEASTNKEQVLKVYHNPPYLVLKGHHSQLRLRWQDSEAIVWHRPK